MEKFDMFVARIFLYSITIALLFVLGVGAKEIITGKFCSNTDHQTSTHSNESGEKHPVPREEANEHG